MEPPDKTLEAWMADVNRDPDTNATLEEFRLAFKMLYLWHGAMYVQQCFMAGKAWLPRIHADDRQWLIDYLKLKEFPPIREPEKKKRKKRKSKDDEY